MGSKEILRAAGMLALLFAYDYISLKNDVIRLIGKLKPVTRWCIYFGIVILIFFWAPSESAEFIYFDF